MYKTQEIKQSIQDTVIYGIYTVKFTTKFYYERFLKDVLADQSEGLQYCEWNGKRVSMWVLL